MDQTTIDAELASAAELIDSTSAGHLAYVAEDGTPRVVTVGIFWTGEEFVVATAATAPKVAALQAHPAVALTLDAGGSPEQAQTLSVRGDAEIRIVDGVVEEYLAAAYKNLELEAAAQFEKGVRQMYDRMARIALRPQWARHYDFGVGRMPKFMQELAERSGWSA